MYIFCTPEYIYIYTRTNICMYVCMFVCMWLNVLQVCVRHACAAVRCSHSSTHTSIPPAETSAASSCVKCTAVTCDECPA